MIYFENTDLFTHKIILGEDSSDLCAINIKIDPKKFDLKTVKKVPFCTIIIKGFSDICHNSMDDDAFYREITRLSKVYNLSIFNMYTDIEYPDIISKFDSGYLFHTLLLFIDTTKKMTWKNPNPNIIIAGIPTFGVVSPIKKSINYDMYNGKFIHCKAFKYNNTFNNGIVFIFVKLRSYISIDEYVINEKETDPFSPISGYLIQHMWWTCINEKSECEFSKSENKYSIIYNGNEKVFSKPGKNLFYLSDIPSGIIQRGETITTRMI